MYTKPVAPLSIGGVLDDAIRLYGASFRSCWPISLLGSIILGAVGVYAASQLRGITVSQNGVQGLGAAMQSLAQYGRGPQLLSNLVVTLVTLLVYGALSAQMNSVATGTPHPAVGAALSLTLRRLPGMVMSAIVFVFAVVIGFIFLLVPGIYLWGKLEFWFTAIFVDDVGAIEGLGRSWSITTGNWWRSSTILSIAVIIYIALSVVQLLVASALAGLMVGMYHSDLGGALVSTQAVNFVMQVFMLPMLPAALLATYNDMKLRRDGGDLIARANSLQSA